MNSMKRIWIHEDDEIWLKKFGATPSKALGEIRRKLESGDQVKIDKYPKQVEMNKQMIQNLNEEVGKTQEMVQRVVTLNGLKW